MINEVSQELIPYTIQNSRKGQAVIIADERYKENLIAKKLNYIKKEP